MIRLSLFLAVAGVTGAAAASARTEPATTAPKAAAVSPRKATTEPVTQAALNTNWYSQYGVYNARTGTTSLVPVRFNPRTTNVPPVGRSEDGC
jgi:hypothetical protein